MRDLPVDHLAPHFNLRTSFYFLGFVARNLVKFFFPVKPAKQPKIEIREDEVAVWYIGHATTLINFYGTTVLTDPVLGKGLPFPKRVRMPGISFKNLPPVDLVILSHAHMDHWNKGSLRKLSKICDTVLIPSSCSDLVPNGYKHIVEARWDETITLKGLSIKTYRPLHWGERYPWQRLNRHYNSYLIEKQDKRIFFAGDTAYCDMFTEVAKQGPADIAMLPITSYNPPSFRTFHLNPEDAVRAFIDLRAKYLIPIHWGNFNLSLEPIEEPPHWLAQLAREKNISDKVQIIDNGQKFSLTSHEN